MRSAILVLYSLIFPFMEKQQYLGRSPALRVEGGLLVSGIIVGYVFRTSDFHKAVFGAQTFLFKYGTLQTKEHSGGFIFFFFRIALNNL